MPPMIAGVAAYANKDRGEHTLTPWSAYHWCPTGHRRLKAAANPTLISTIAASAQPGRANETAGRRVDLQVGVWSVDLEQKSDKAV